MYVKIPCKAHNKIVDKHHIDNYNKHKTEVKYIIYLSNRKQKSYCFSKLNENSMPFGRKIQFKKTCVKRLEEMKIFRILESRKYYLKYYLRENLHPVASSRKKNKRKGEAYGRKKDITEKILADYNDVFADIMNGLLFAGEQRILPEALENTSIHSQYKAEDEKVHELERDVAKYWKEKEVELAICGIENQSVVEKNMPFRVIGYDGTAYRSQLLEERKKILPVVTIVLYFGTDRHWNSKKILNL